MAAGVSTDVDVGEYCRFHHWYILTSQFRTGTSLFEMVGGSCT